MLFTLLLFGICYFNYLFQEQQSSVRRGNLTRSILELPLLQALFLFHFRGPLADYLSLRPELTATCRHYENVWRYCLRRELVTFTHEMTNALMPQVLHGRQSLYRF